MEEENHLQAQKEIQARTGAARYRRNARRPHTLRLCDQPFH